MDAINKHHRHKTSVTHSRPPPFVPTPCRSAIAPPFHHLHSTASVSPSPPRFRISTIFIFSMPPPPNRPPFSPDSHHQQSPPFIFFIRWHTIIKTASRHPKLPQERPLQRVILRAHHAQLLHRVTHNLPSPSRHLETRSLRGHLAHIQNGHHLHSENPNSENPFAAQAKAEGEALFPKYLKP
ncbi:hypothetical protein LR48_Vigan01g161000 [Vigna angularis]|uniref:Uncharacterized protein n=1 Tax=Phaseolus angularis TaxID=3914 RepID=A0A0L9TPH1_PHAAN|nr:hypothetical protein LR48_Vigan01g161000 [Vigna angularis]